MFSAGQITGVGTTFHGAQNTFLPMIQPQIPASIDSFVNVAPVSGQLNFPGARGSSLPPLLAAPGSRPAGSSSGSGGEPPPPPGGSSRGPRVPKSISAIVSETESPEGEIKLLMAAMAGRKQGLEWMEMVRRGLAGELAFKVIAERPLVRALVELTSGVMAPEIDNFTSESRTPWGGTLIPVMKRGLGNFKGGKVVGESWEISGHPAFPNKFKMRYAGRNLSIDTGLLNAAFSKYLYGREDNAAAEMPFLVKLLNSGSWERFVPELSRLLGDLDEKPNAPFLREAVRARRSLQEVAGRDYAHLHEALSDLIRLMLEPMLGKSDSLKNAAQWRKDLKVARLRDIVKYPPARQHKAVARLAMLQEKSGFKNFVWGLRDAAALIRLHVDMMAMNLSVQVHPSEEYAGLKEGEHSKTEAWIIVDAEEGAGLYLGLKRGVTREGFSQLLAEGGDVTSMLNFVPVKAGDVFYIPAGTVHAIGAGVLLVEPQETSETTYRVYDYGRLDGKGRPRKLHVDQAMAVIDWSAPRGEAAVKALRRELAAGESAGSNASRQRLVEEGPFEVSRISMGEGGSYSAVARTMTGYTVVDGAVVVTRDSDGSHQGEYFRGQSFIVPAAVGAYTVTGTATGSVLIETKADR